MERLKPLGRTAGLYALYFKILFIILFDDQPDISDIHDTRVFLRHLDDFDHVIFIYLGLVIHSYPGKLVNGYTNKRVNKYTSIQVPDFDGILTCSAAGGTNRIKTSVGC